MINDSISLFTQSQYYSTAFNAAIFDGPIRIYFAQYQEPAALKIYFQLQKELKETYLLAKDLFRQTGKHIFIMLYPSVDLLQMSFANESSSYFCRDIVGSDEVIGLCATQLEDEVDQLFEAITEIIEDGKVEVLKNLPIHRLNN